MIKFTLGFILGVAAATVGFSKETQRVVKDVSKSDAASEVKRTVSKAVDEVSK